MLVAKAGCVLAVLLWAQGAAAVGGTGELHRSSGLSLGSRLVRYQDEFGFGLALTSSYFAGRSMAVRISGDLCFLDAVLDPLPSGETESTWTRFWLLRAGLTTVAGMAGRSCRLYGEGGIALALPSDRFSDDAAVGGYGLFGFEFFPGDPSGSPVSYFIEMGGTGLGARAEKLPAKPGYANGFLLSAGFRIYP